MGEARLQAGIPLLLVLLLLGMSQTSFTSTFVLDDNDAIVKHAGGDPGVSDVPHLESRRQMGVFRHL